MMPPALRFALRSLRRARVFSAFVVTSVAIGICTVTLVGGTVYAALFRPLPYREPARLVYLSKTSSEAHPEWHEPFSARAYSTIASERTLGLTRIAAFKELDAVMTNGSSGSDRIRAVAAEWNLFTVLGVRAQRGRFFSSEDAMPGSPPVVVVSNRLWTRVWAGSDSAVGSSMRMNGELRKVIGVAPFGVEFPLGTDVWVPLAVGASAAAAGSVNAIARIPPTTTLTALSERLRVLASRLKSQHDGVDTVGVPDDERIAAFNTTDLASAMRPRAGSSIWLLATVTACCILIGCANVCGLFVLRGASRGGEMAVRVALGASRWRIAAQLLWEGSVLSLVGGALGIVAAVLAKGALEAFFASTNQALTVTLASPVIAVAVMVTTIIAMLFAIVPVARMDTQALERQLRSDAGATAGRHVSHARQIVVALEIAGALILINASISLTRSADALDGMQSGIEIRNLAIAKVDLEPTSYPTKPAISSAISSIEQALRRVPGITGVAIWSTRAPRLSIGPRPFRIDGTQDGPARAVPMFTYDVNDEFFGVLGVRLRRGRLFTLADDAASLPVAVVNQDFANKTWPGIDPLGRRFSLTAYPEAQQITVVGVVENTENLRENAAFYTDRMNKKFYPLVFRPMAQTGAVTWGTNSHPDLYFAARTSERTQPIAQMRRAISETEPYADIESLSSYAAFRSLPQLVVSAAVIALVSGVSVVLGMVGVFGIVQDGVRRRTAELSLRSVLGASNVHILEVVLREAIIAVLAGTLLYVLVSVGMSAQLSRWLFAITDNNPKGILIGTDAFDPLVVVISQAVVWLAVLIASVVPVRRALRIEPNQALRSSS